MEIINPNSLPGGNARACGTDALQPPHQGGEGGCSHCYGNIPDDPCIPNNYGDN